MIYALRELRSKFKSGIKNPLFIFVILLALLPLALQEPYLLYVATLVLIYIVIAVSWNILAESGQFSLGHAAFFGIGAYTSTLLYKYFLVNPLLGMPFSALTSCALALLMGVICLPLREFYLAIATLALSEVLRTIVIMLPEITGGAVGLGIPPLFGGNRVLNYYLMLAIAVIALSTLYAVRRSKLYLALVTLRCDEVVASSIGINPVKYRLYAFLLSALFPGLCGGFFSFYVGFIDPFSVFNIEISIAPQIMSVLGGIYTFWGPIIGALIIEPVKEFLRISMPTGYLVVYGIIMILCIRFLPRGIMEALKAYTGMSEAVPVGGRKCSR